VHVGVAELFEQGAMRAEWVCGRFSGGGNLIGIGARCTFRQSMFKHFHKRIVQRAHPIVLQQATKTYP
jgi:hypothetical protein